MFGDFDIEKSLPDFVRLHLGVDFSQVLAHVPVRLGPAALSSIMLVKVNYVIVTADKLYGILLNNWGNKPVKLLYEVPLKIVTGQRVGAQYILVVPSEGKKPRLLHLSKDFPLRIAVIWNLIGARGC